MQIKYLSPLEREGGRGREEGRKEGRKEGRSRISDNEDSNDARQEHMTYMLLRKSSK